LSTPTTVVVNAKPEGVFIAPKEYSSFLQPVILSTTSKENNPIILYKFFIAYYLKIN
jgi:hypothetical protein